MDENRWIVSRETSRDRQVDEMFHVKHYKMAWRAIWYTWDIVNSKTDEVFRVKPNDKDETEMFHVEHMVVYLYRRN